jgi:hypothetical protein
MDQVHPYTEELHMHRTNLWTASLLGAHLLSACGDDGGTTVSAGDTEGATALSDGTSSTTTPPTSGDSEATTGIGSVSDSLGETTTTTATTGPDPTTTPDPDTTASTVATDPDPSTGTTQGVDDTGESTEGESTAGESTEGESTAGESSTTEDPSETGDPADCPLIMQHTPCDEASNDALHAFGLNCTSLGGDYVDGVNAVSITGLSFQAPNMMQGKRTWQVARSYGSFVDPNTNQPFWGPREGEKLLMISSGLLPAPNNQGAVLIDDGSGFGDADVYNDAAVGGQWDSDVMPPPMTAVDGSPDPMGFTNCDGVNDCSNTIETQWDLGGGDPEDKMWFGFELTAPAIANGDTVDANGYTFDFAYFSAEFPEWVNTDFNDIFVVWQDSEDYTGNVTFINEQPMTVTALWPIDYQGECDFLDPNCAGADEHLADTGHLYDGGATGWYKALGGINPGETFTLTFGIFDMGDSVYDTTALLDNWQWDCEGCVPSEVMECGIDPQ